MSPKRPPRQSPKRPLPIRVKPSATRSERPGDLIEIIYMSDAAPQMEDDAIVDIIRAAGDNNRRLNITGLLLYDGSHFLQVMEGERRHVARTYSDILADPRHRNVVTIHEGCISERVFDSWGMAYRRIRTDSEVLQLARRQLQTGRAVQPILTDVGKWIAASFDPVDDYIWSSRDRDLEPG